MLEPTNAKLATLALLVSTACAAAAQTTFLPATALGPGWSCFINPTTFFAPGTIFAIREDGLDRIKDLSSSINTQRGSAVVPQLENVTRSEIGILATLSRRLLGSATASVEAGGQISRGDRVKYQAVTEEQTEKAAEAIAEDWIRANPRAFLEIRSGVKYHFVRAAYLAGNVEYEITTDTAAKLGGEASIRSAGKFTVNLVDTQSGKRLQLSEILSPPLRVCIRARPIEVRSAGITGENELGIFQEDSVLPPELTER